MALRLDPSDEVGAEALITRIRVAGASNAQAVPVQQLATWLVSQIRVEAAADGIRLTTLGRDAYTMGGVDIDVTDHPWGPVSFLRLDPKTLGLALLGSALGAVLLAVKRHGIPVALGNALLLTMGTLAAYWVALWALSSLHATPDVSVAVGWQAFFGRPKAVDLAAMNLFMAVEQADVDRATRHVADVGQNLVELAGPQNPAVFDDHDAVADFR